MKDVILRGSVLDKIKEIPDKYVNCVITSPPYFGLRKYDGEQDIDWPEITYIPMTSTQPIIIPAMTQAYGAEKSVEAYIAHTVYILREIKRVLRDDGIIWWNLGDSYAANTKGSGGMNSKQPTNAGSFYSASFDLGAANLKPKDLIGIPWRVAFALQADGWYLRQDIIWHKPNPMPESVTDRCTKAHEYVFLLSKSARYFYDAEAVKESSIYPDDNRKARQSQQVYEKMIGDNGQIRAVINPKNAKTYPTRNRRSVWTIATRPFRGAHFAVFPKELIRPMILAGCPKEGIVLDPFFGSGTTGTVAKVEERHYIGIEISDTYADMAEKRIKETIVPLF